MTIALVQTIADDGFSSASFTLTLGSTPVEDNVLFAFITMDGTSVIVPPSGWTEVDERADGNAQIRHGIYWKVAGASEDTAHVWTTAVGEKWVGCIYELSDVNTDSPVDGTPVFATAKDTAPTSPTFTPTVSGVMVMAGCGCENFDTITADAGLDNTWTEQTTTGGACSAGGGLDLRADTSATGAYVHAITGANDWVAYTIGASPSGPPQLNAESASFTVAGGEVVFFTKGIEAEAATFAVSGSNVGLLTEEGWWQSPFWGGDWWEGPWWTAVLANRELSVDSATYTVSAKDVSITKGPILDVETAAYVVTATAVGVEKGFQVNADLATYTVEALDVTLNNAKLLADSATFTVTTNTDVLLTRDAPFARFVDADSATFTLSALGANPAKGFICYASPAAYTVTANAVLLEIDTELVALRATFTVTAGDVNLVSTQTHSLDVDSASFLVSASAITFSKDAIAATFGEYDKTNIIKPEPHGAIVSCEGQGFFFR